MATRLGKRPPVQNARVWATLLSTFTILILAACSLKPFEAMKPVSEQPGQHSKINTDSLKPGLAVYYKRGFWRHVDQMPKPDSFVEEGKQGKPITRIDHRFGQGNVFDSGFRRGVGVQMMGYIHLYKRGKWLFRVNSNDGIEVVIEETVVVSDPEWHSDRFSDPMDFQVEKSGWYPILLRYFQRKGTATLEFYWKPPGEQEFIIIPEKAYGHLPHS